MITNNRPVIMIKECYMNDYFDRAKTRENIINILTHFESDKTTKKGIYIFGTPGCGKSVFVKEILTFLEYDTIVYDAGDVRNKLLFTNIDSNHISNCNVLDLMRRKKRKIAILMDEIDGMNNGDKGGIDALIKLIRQKKTKKQKCENTTLNPIICIGNHGNDKKIRELMKASHVFELKTPSNAQMSLFLENNLAPYNTFDQDFKQDMLHYIQGDFRKLFFILKIWKHKPEIIDKHILRNIFHVKMFNEDAKTNVWSLLQKPIPLTDHNVFMNETDRTTVSLLWHENVAEKMKGPLEKTFPFYRILLSNICFADYIGRITFQSQIWQFNEMTSLIKTFYNNRLLHDAFPENDPTFTIEKVEFTKVLTKYSTEYNNQIFLQGLCQRMNMDKKDVLHFFQELRIHYGEYFYLNSEKLKHLELHFQKDEIDILDIKRIYRFLDKNIKKEDNIIVFDESTSDSE